MSADRALLHDSSSATHNDAVSDWVHRIRGEYRESPGLHLTARQVQRLWNLDAATCEAVLTTLETTRFLRRTHTGAYVKA